MRRPGEVDASTLEKRFAVPKKSQRMRDYVSFIIC